MSHENFCIIGRRMNRGQPRYMPRTAEVTAVPGHFLLRLHTAHDMDEMQLITSTTQSETMATWNIAWYQIGYLCYHDGGKAMMCANVGGGRVAQHIIHA